MVRIHFGHDPTRLRVGAAGPLARVNADERRAELATMCSAIRLRHPDAQLIRGTSWLYNLPAYQRLFPPAYADSRAPVGASLRYQGLSTLR